MQIINFMFRGFPQFLGCFIILALILFTLENILTSLFDCLKTIFKREKNNFYICEKNIDEKFLEEIKKHSKKIKTVGGD